MENLLTQEYLQAHPYWAKFVFFVADRPLISSLLSILLLTLIYVFIKGFFIKDSDKPYLKRVYGEWLGFAILLGEVMWTIVSAIVFYLVVPFFYVIFLRPKDLLGTNLNKDSFWEDAKEVSFDMKRNYRQY